jgi:hypothetical protein
VTHFNTSIPTKKSFTELFGITQVKDGSTRTYLKRFNEEMLKVENLIKSVAFKALISRVKEKALWKKLYALPDRRLLKVKQAMESHIQVEEASTLSLGPPYFTRDKQSESSLDEVACPNKTALLEEIPIPRGIRRNQPGNVWVILKYMLLL